MKKIIARDEELKIFRKILSSKKAEFLAVYGRRRVGKTYIIREFFSENSVLCEITGRKGEPMAQQLAEVASSVGETFFKGVALETPENWHKAFELILKNVKNEDEWKKKSFVLFLDELPWLSTDRSDCVSALDYYWNKYFSRLPHFKLIICGSAASWMLDKIINAKGGLHNRLTQTLLLKPFDLTKTAQYLKYLGIRWSQKQILSLYMVMGGIPYYLDQLNSEDSLVQNINRLCFTEGGLFQLEFSKLFTSLFDMAEENLSLVRAIASQNKGLSRAALLDKLNLSSGGALSARLSELESAGFIKAYRPFGKTARDSFYRVIDEYVLFYLHWIEESLRSGHSFAEGYWETKQNTPSFHSWSGFSFENICIKHVEKIRQKLGLNRIGCLYSSWFYSPPKGSDKTGAQVDLLIDRDDGVISLCEIKYSDKVYVLDKATAKNIHNKADVFTEITHTTKQIEIVAVTTFGVKPGLWADEVIQQEVQASDLF